MPHIAALIFLNIFLGVGARAHDLPLIGCTEAGKTYVPLRAYLSDEAVQAKVPWSFDSISGILRGQVKQSPFALRTEQRLAFVAGEQLPLSETLRQYFGGYYLEAGVMRSMISVLGLPDIEALVLLPCTTIRRTVSRHAVPSFVVVIDPGHGGLDPGTTQGLLQEKDIVLRVAEHLRSELVQDPSVQVILTREADYFLQLFERTELANIANAGIFVSLHVNSGQRLEARGVETYYLSANPTDSQARLLAARENAHATGVSTEDNLEFVLSDLKHTHIIAESAKLASALHEKIHATVGTENRGIRQAPFYVLFHATMPAVLVELGFITNKDDQQLLSGKLDKYAHALYEGIQSYKRTRHPGGSHAQ